MAKTRYFSLTVLFCSVILLVAGTLPLGVQPAFADEPVTVSLEESVTSVKKGDTFVLTVQIGEVTAFDSSNYTVVFDTSMFELSAVADGFIGDTVIPVALWNEEFDGHFTIVNNVSGVPGVDGFGYLSKLHFAVIGSQSGIYEIGLEDGVLVSTENGEIPSVWQGTEITVKSSGSSGGGFYVPPDEDTGEEGPLNPAVTSFADTVSDEGVFQQSASAASADGQARLEIASGTVAVTADGEPLTEVTMEPASDISDDEEFSTGFILAGQVYEVGPSGAEFSPPVVLTLSYDPFLLLEGTSEADLVIAFRDESGNVVVLDDCLVEVTQHTVSVSISHFSQYGVVVPEPVEPEFTVTGLTLSESSVSPGEMVTVTASVTNSATVDGLYELAARVNDVEEYLETVAVAAGETKTVEFEVTGDTAGRYVVSVGGQTAVFTVEEPEPEPEDSIPGQPQSTAAPVEEVQEPSQEEPEPGINWGIWGVILAVVVVVVVAGVLHIVNRKSRN